MLWKVEVRVVEVSVMEVSVMKGGSVAVESGSVCRGSCHKRCLSWKVEVYVVEGGSVCHGKWKYLSWKVEVSVMEGGRWKLS